MHPDLAPAGQFSWRTSWHQQQTQLFKQDNNDIVGPSRFIAQSEYGFSDRTVAELAKFYKTSIDALI